jgi:hypothetical protein
MTAIAPPPVGTETEPSVQRDNARALEVLRRPSEALAPPRRAPPRARRLAVLFGALLGLGAVSVLALWSTAARARFFFGFRRRRRLALSRL